MTGLELKERRLEEGLKSVPSLVVAYSGGVDSAYLAYAAHRVLGKRMLAVTALSASYSARDRREAQACVERFRFPHEFVETGELENPAYRANSPNRCYFCKDELFQKLDELVRQRGYAAVAYGVNVDDQGDWRPGQRAAREHQVLTPLLDAELTKSEIRELARRAGLPVWDRPASACLSSRIAYGIEVTPERLAVVEKGEEALHELGFRQVRVRHHENLVRIEIAPEELPRALTPEMARKFVDIFKPLGFSLPLGFSFVTLDLEGYRQGSLNTQLVALPGRGSSS
ncbi:MAG: ATP-dependent sacrificial sulfur transferase LarE [Acidobacteria bacterium]|nr:MAG: ATP-dependent sacrificial sulfur transferase LarE [Acidobacteriota bacterium]